MIQKVGMLLMDYFARLPVLFSAKKKQADSIVMRSREMMMMMWPCCLVLLQQSITVLRVVLPHPFSCVGTKDWWMPEWLLTPLKNTCCQLLATQLNFLVLTVANNSKGAKLSSRIEYVFISLLSSNIKWIGYLESNKCIREKKAAAVLHS